MNVPIEAFHQSERNFFSAISVRAKKFENLTAYLSGVDASGLNPTMVHGVNKASFHQDLLNSQAFYIQQQVSTALIVPEYLQSKSSKLIKTQGLHLIDEGVAMVCCLTTWPVQPPESHLLIQAMNHDLSQWSIPLTAGFESTPEKTSVYVQRHRAALEKIELYHFSGFVAQQAVCSLTVSLLGKHYARIDDVATIPEHQGRGYATELIHYTLDFLKKKHIETCFLEASSSGLSIYQKIGFRELFKNYYYE
ncbi:N-acetyltransferase [Legionella sp. km772]|uniref:GNAT family N-acetyltransferase n=1 Tax=Legionella sp. km772 TaxID=2498111 RepID=UPI000F8D301A|nr:GNAT family N-acetyltransferase [Legionella sp. km772]RUR07825.1 GNAT family N-acetyltransferase [Legionella sp. km772]